MNAKLHPLSIACLQAQLRSKIPPVVTRLWRHFYGSRMPPCSLQAQLRSKIVEFDEEKPADSVKQDASVVSGELLCVCHLLFSSGIAG